MNNINNKNLIYSVFGLLFAVVSVAFFMPSNAKAEICVITDPYEYRGYCNSTNNTNNYNNNYYGSNYGYNNSYNNRLNPVPFVGSINPSSLITNSNSTITVKGNNFVQGSIIRIDNNLKPTTFIDSQTLQTTLNSFEASQNGEHIITVFNPTPGGGYSNATSFTVNSYIAPVVNNNSNVVKNTATSKTKTNTTNNPDSIKNTSGTDQNVKDLAAGAIFGSNAFMPSSLLQWIFFAIFILIAVILWRKLYVSDADKHTPLKHA